MLLNTPISQLGSIGRQLDKKLKYLNIRTVQDLLFYLPFRYEDYSQSKFIKDLQPEEQVTIRARVEVIGAKRSFRSRRLVTEAIVSDESGRLKIIWFGQPFVAKVIKVGEAVYFSGKVSIGKFGIQLTNPNYEKETGQKARGEKETTHTARIIPMYHLTTGISHKQLRFLVSQAIGAAKELKEWLPEEILEKADLVSLSEAVRGIHFPIDQTDLEQARRRLKFGELYILQLRSEMIRQSLKKSSASPLDFKEKEIKEFVSRLPFTLTKAQKVAAWEILQDLEKTQPMNRLLEGDVGSGKTVVAAMALYNTVLNGYQGVLMAPTEILGMQHFQSISVLLRNFDIKIALLTSGIAQINHKSEIINHKSPAKQKNAVLDQIKKGDIKLIVGTHALLSEKVEFKNLGLAIVDEQHRFGVEQRKNIREKTTNKDVMPHFLSMTATPIPRSFALLLYGDLDLSIINEMPSDRKIIKTRLVEPHNREKAYEFIREQVKQGRQCFVICPLIDERVKNKEKRISELTNDIDSYPSLFTLYSLNSEKKTVMSEYEKLSQTIFPDLKIGYLHGKLKAKEKQATMDLFANGKIDILVSTSVVEVGVNIPNASVMMIEEAERYGLAQLHQFRGRVGRSSHQSYCLLFSNTESEKALERLDFFANSNDGFKVAEYDLQTRGPGDVYGTSQSGMPNFRLATLQDIELIKLARDLAKGTDFDKKPSLKERVREWERGVHWE